MVSIKPNLDPTAWKTADELKQTDGSPANRVNFFQAIGFKTSGTSYKSQQLSASQLTPAVAAATGQSSSPPPANTSPGPGLTTSSTSASNNQALGQSLAATYGWGTGSEWSALNSLVMAESGWNNTAQNPTSTAYGIGQFLDTTWATVGGTKTSNPTTQIKLMLAYIKMRYGTPAAAWAHEQADHWY